MPNAPSMAERVLYLQRPARSVYFVYGEYRDVRELLCGPILAQDDAARMIDPVRAKLEAMGRAGQDFIVAIVSFDRAIHIPPAGRMNDEFPDLFRALNRAALRAD